MDAKQTVQNDSPEQLLDVFKAAALSVTKLYKSSVAAETRARSDGYQDCLDDLFAFMDREGHNIREDGLSRLRKWATERRDGRDPSPQTGESEDETDKPSAASVVPVNNDPPPPPMTESMPDTASPISEPRQPEFVVPSQENFTFQSDHQYPNIELLDLSDARSHSSNNGHPRSRRGKNGMRSAGHLGRGAGAKRRMDFDDFFGGCLGGKDTFGGGGKRSRHT